MHGIGALARRSQVLLIALLVVTGLALTIWISHEQAVQRETYLLEQGTWTPIELEREFILLQSMLHQLAAGDPISLEEYQHRRDLSLGYITVLVNFAHDNPTFDAEQMQLTAQLVQNVAQYWRLEGIGVPDRWQAQQVAVLMDKTVDLSHQLTNLRRQVAEVATIRSIHTTQAAQAIQIATVTLLVITGIWVVRSTRQSAAKDMAIVQLQAHTAEEAATRLQSYTAQAEELAATQERNRIAREMHDGVKAHLNNALLRVRYAPRVLAGNPTEDELATVQAELTVAKDELMTAYDALDTAIDALVSDEHLAGSLAELLAGPVRDCELAGVKISMEITGTPCPIPTSVKQGMYRIVQEATLNIRKHSQAKNAHVLLDYGDHQRLRVVIEDDGVGIPANVKQRPGHGLDNLQERASLMGGITSIQTAPGQGVRIVTEVVTHE